MLDPRRELIGRDEELALLADFLAGIDRLPGAFILEGEAGIGKTALWAAGVDLAEAAGYTVLAARPAEAETKIAHTVLRDLLGPSFAEVSPQLPAPQREALEAAFLLSDAGVGVDRGAIGVATLSLLRWLAVPPTVIALDDAQWIDAPSAAALGFAARRLDEIPVALLLAVRSPHADADPPALARALPDERVRRERVGPLSIGAVHALVRMRLGMTFPRPLLGRLHTISGGNPFYALELARALARRGGIGSLGRELPAPIVARARRGTTLRPARGNPRGTRSRSRHCLDPCETDGKRCHRAFAPAWFLRGFVSSRSSAREPWAPSIWRRTRSLDVASR